MRLVALENHDLDAQVCGIIHCAKAQGQMIRHSGVSAENWASAGGTERFGNLGALVRQIGEPGQISADGDRFCSKHRADCVACSARPAAFIAVTLRHDIWDTFSGIADGTAQAFSGVFLCHTRNSTAVTAGRNLAASS